jgi:uracil-DNA glycosylase
LEIATLDDSWLGALHEELTKPYFLALKRFLADEKKKKTVVFPPENDIYSWSRLTPLHDVKVIILGQDPYHNYNQAHGLAFSVNPPTPPPPSLKNMYKGIANDYTDFKVPKTGSLIPWAQQGVLLLNACLTVRAHNANSHAGRGWETFTEKVLEAAIKSRPSGVVFLAWGSPAAKRVDKIRPGAQHLVLKTVHPSPLSAARGFFTAGHFRKANDWLLKVYGPQGLINWALEKGNIITDIERYIGEAAVPKEERAESLCNAVNNGKTESVGPKTP